LRSFTEADDFCIREFRGAEATHLGDLSWIGFFIFVLSLFYLSGDADVVSELGADCNGANPHSRIPSCTILRASKHDCKVEIEEVINTLTLFADFK
jgi:hypothetical protein